MLRPPDRSADSDAHRFIHVCYSCSDFDAVTTLFGTALGLTTVVSSPPTLKSGDILGVDGQIVAGMSFLYDDRGARTGPGIEVHEWVDPPLCGTPPLDPLAIGTQSLGFAVADPQGTALRMQEFGCQIVGTGTSPFAEPWVTVRDPRNVTLDLVADPRATGFGSRVRHLRITCDDLTASLAWYQRLGFTLLDVRGLTEPGYLGIRGSARATVARLRLPDERFELVLVGWTEPAGYGRHPSQPNHAGLYRAAVAVTNTRKTFAALTSEGWSVGRPPKLVKFVGKEVPDMWIAFVTDPNGVPVELVQRPREAFRADEPLPIAASVEGGHR